MNPPRSFNATPPFGWFDKQTLRHLQNKLAEKRYRKRAARTLVHYFVLCQICSDRGGQAAFQATMNEIGRLTHSSRRCTRLCLHDLERIGVINRKRESNGRSYIYCLLALPDSEGTGGYTVPHPKGKPGYRVPHHRDTVYPTPPQTGVQRDPLKKNKETVRLPTLNELLGISSVHEKKGEKKDPPGNAGSSRNGK